MKISYLKSGPNAQHVIKCSDELDEAVPPWRHRVEPRAEGQSRGCCFCEWPRGSSWQAPRRLRLCSTSCFWEDGGQSAKCLPWVRLLSLAGFLLNSTAFLRPAPVVSSLRVPRYLHARVWLPSVCVRSRKSSGHACTPTTQHTGRGAGLRGAGAPV